MLGPYSAGENGQIFYKGNKLFSPVNDVLKAKYPTSEVQNRTEQFVKEEMWGKIARINHQIFLSAVNYFSGKGALFTPLPLTTRMISSPGAVYGREAINYTSDTCPITLKWFDLPMNAFLSESSQIYLELALAQPGVDQVFAVYNSFRKEEADATHLSEFRHIEYEGKVDQEQNKEIVLGLVNKTISDLLKNNLDDLLFFLEEQKLKELSGLTDNIKRITFKEALRLLYKSTGDEKYKEFTMKYFGSWEEVKLTELTGGLTIVTEYPLLEVPFYHAVIDGSSPQVANNADFIWPGYREFVGSGHRVRSQKELEEKSTIFNLPKEDYTPYLQTRKFQDYHTSSGFGMGWERFLQGLLEMPFIWSATHFPRGHTTLKP